MNLFDWHLPLKKIEKPVRLIEAFSGIGAQAKALERLGVPFEHYRSYDNDKYAVASYNAVHGTDFSPTDICDVHGEDLGIVDTDKYEYILTYSFPCQDLSHAGRMAGMQKGSGTRSGLLWEIERILNECETLPDIMLMENVVQVVSDQNMPDFAAWCGFLESKGYTNTWTILNAKDYGVPQNRERCFMISIQGEYAYEFPQPIELRRKMRDILESDVPERYYIADEAADELCSQIVHAEREREVAHGIRCGGRNTYEWKHAWDVVFDPPTQNERQTTREQIAAWQSTYNPLEHVLGKEDTCRCLLANNLRNNSGMILLSEDIDHERNLR